MPRERRSRFYATDFTPTGRTRRPLRRRKLLPACGMRDATDYPQLRHAAIRRTPPLRVRDHRAGHNAPRLRQRSFRLLSPQRASGLDRQGRGYRHRSERDLRRVRTGHPRRRESVSFESSRAALWSTQLQFVSPCLPSRRSTSTSPSDHPRQTDRVDALGPSGASFSSDSFGGP